MIPLGLMILGFKDLLIIVLAGLAAAAFAAWIFRKDTEQEARLKGYGEVSAWLKEVKLVHSAEIMACLSVKDLSGAAKELLHLVKLLKDTKNRLDLLKNCFYHLLALLVKSEEDWPKIKKIVDDQQAAIKAEAGRRLAAIKAEAAKAEAEAKAAVEAAPVA